MTPAETIVDLHLAAGPTVATPADDGSWVVATVIFTATVLLAGFAASMLIETAKKSLLLGEWTRRQRSPGEYGKGIFKVYVTATILSTALSAVIGWAIYDPWLLGVAGVVGGLGSRQLYVKILEPALRAVGYRASKRIAGRTVAPRPRNEETAIGAPPAKDESDG